MEQLEMMANRHRFNAEMGEGFRIFRTTVLHKTLREIGGQTLVPSLSNFETGKLFRYEYFFYYVMACKDEKQLEQLVRLVSLVMECAWKRGVDYDEKN